MPGGTPGARIEQWRGVLGRREIHDLLGRISTVGWPSGEQREHRGADAPDVGAWVDFVVKTEGLLSRHVAGCTHRPSDLHRPQSGRVADACDPEIENLQRSVAQDEQIVGLDVAMDDSLSVSRPEHIEELMAEVRNLAHGQRSTRALPKLANSLSIEKLHDEKHRSVGVYVVIQDAHGPRVRHRIGCIALAEKTLAQIIGGRQRRVEHLDRNTMSIPVRALIHCSHAAHADERIKSVLVTASARRVVQRMRGRRPSRLPTSVECHRRSRKA